MLLLMIKLHVGKDYNLNDMANVGESMLFVNLPPTVFFLNRNAM